MSYSVSITVQKTQNLQDYLSDRTIHPFFPLDELKHLKIELKVTLLKSMDMKKRSSSMVSVKLL